MKFQQRLNRYLLGVVIGLVLVFVMFNGRDWLGWLPANRVKARIENSELTWDENMRCRLMCHGFTKPTILDLVKRGDVDFGASETKSKPREYQVHFDAEHGRFDMRFKLFDPVGEAKPKAEIVQVKYEGTASFVCDC